MRRMNWLGFAAMFSAALAFAQPAPEKIITQNGVSFVSGGIGVASQERLEAREKEFDLKLVFTLVEGNYLADIGVTVTDAAGKTVIRHVADGPFFMAQLPAGTYSVMATRNGQTQTRKVTVRSGRLLTEYIRWPSKPGIDFPLLPEKAGVTRPAIAQTPEQARQDMKFLSGGIGVASQEQLQAREKEFNLKLVFTLIEGNYLADVGITIKDAKGKTVVEQVADGPFFLVKLPAGTYSISAVYEGKTETRKVSVRSGRLRTEYLRWPSKPTVDLPISRWLEPGEKPRSRAGP